MDHKRHASVSDQEVHTRIKLPKKLVVCCDGTWMDSDNGWVKGKFGQRGHQQYASNVTRIARAIAPEDKHHHPQIVYYQAGVGTGVGMYNRLIGGGTGMGLAAHVREAYAFLASNYAEHDELVPNDSIFLVGFSRGAFTARTLGGFICSMGILKKKAMPHFYEIFEDWCGSGSGSAYNPGFFDNYFSRHPDVNRAKPDLKLAKSTITEDRDTYLRQYFTLLMELGLTQDVHINCIGVFDTVGALGIPVNPLLQRMFPFLPSFLRNYRWYDTRLDSEVKNAFQALALDEKRSPFSPAIWEKPAKCKTNLQQVWFPGAHTNVGGGYEDPGMSDISLAWMMDQLSGNSLEDRTEFHVSDWLQFDDTYAQSLNLYDCEGHWRENHKAEQYKGWAKGKVYQSCTFPMSLLGGKTRLPGQYHGTHYWTGREDKTRPLENTNEQVHLSVRARIDLGGRGIEPDWAEVFPRGWDIGPIFAWLWHKMTGRVNDFYQPQQNGGPLHGWRLEGGHHPHFNSNGNVSMSPHGPKEVQWVLEGVDEIAKRVMHEARLGDYEMRLLEQDQKLANRVEFTNNRRHLHTKADLRPPRGQTF